MTRRNVIGTTPQEGEMEQAVKACRKLSYGDCICGWRAEFGESWAGHAPHQGFMKGHDAVCIRCGNPASAHGDCPQDSPNGCGWTHAMVLTASLS